MSSALCSCHSAPVQSTWYPAQTSWGPVFLSQCIFTEPTVPHIDITLTCVMSQGTGTELTMSCLHLTVCYDHVAVHLPRAHSTIYTSQSLVIMSQCSQVSLDIMCPVFLSKCTCIYLSVPSRQHSARHSFHCHLLRGQCPV